MQKIILQGLYNIPAGAKAADRRSNPGGGEYLKTTIKEGRPENMSKREQETIFQNLLVSGYTEEEAREIITIILLSL